MSSSSSFSMEIGYLCQVSGGPCNLQPLFLSAAAAAVAFALAASLHRCIAGADRLPRLAATICVFF